jgi:hypothetical protein
MAPAAASSTRRRVIVALAGLLALGTGAGILLSRPSATRQASAPSPAEGPLLDKALRAVTDGDQSAPRDRWDPAYVARALGPDPLLHLAWVREWTLWVPYRGALRGPAGVLMDRQGNSLDRALLLAGMLASVGHEVRLAHGEPSPARVAELLPVLVAARRRATDGPRTRPDEEWRREVERVAGKYDLDPKAMVRTVGTRMDAVSGMLQRLDARTDDQAKRLGRAIEAKAPRDEGAKALARGAAALRDHWWVQWLSPQGWQDLDPLGEARGRAITEAAATVTPEALDSALYHRVVIRLVTERASAAGLRESRALEQVVRPADVPEQPISLQVLPERWQPALVGHSADPAAAFRALALEQEEWRAVLTVGSTTVAEARIERSGRTGEQGGGGFGGLGAAIGKAVGPNTSTAELSAAWLEYEILVPGEPATTVRRQLFELVGPAARAAGHTGPLQLDEARRLERALALFRTVDILPLGSAVAPEFVVHLAADALVANQDFLRSPGPAEDPGSTPALEEFGRLAKPLPSSLYTLALVRLPPDQGSEVFLDHPNFLSRHQYLAAGSAGVTRVEATDIVANEVGVALDAPRPADARRRQGVRDTNAEAVLHETGERVSSVAEAYAGKGDWVTISSRDDRFLEKVSPDLRARMEADLRAGFTLVAPADAARAASPAATGWWRVDPVSGHTLGVSGIGYGQDLIQYFVIIAGAVAVGYTFEYLLCAGAIPGTSPTVASAGAPLDWLVGSLNAQPLPAGDPCIWEAWKAGILAGMWQSVSVAWPLLVRRFPILEFFDRPVWASGGAGSGESGDPPPLLGNNPAKPPPPECPPGGGGAPAAGGAPQEGPPPETPPAEGPPAEMPPGEAAPQPGEVPPEESPMPQPARGGGGGPSTVNDDLPPIDPAEMQATVENATAAANAARPQLGPARAKLQEAQAAAEAAQQEYQAADAAAEADKNSIEAAVRASKALDQVTAAKANVAKAQQEVARLEQILAREAYAKQLQPLNDALYRARAEYLEVQQRFAKAIQTGEADFQGSQYQEWQQSFNRYNRALKDYAKGYWNQQPAPPSGSPAPGGPGQTQPLPQGPAGPGQTQPLGQGPQQSGQTQPLGQNSPMPEQPQPSGPGPAGPSGGKNGNTALGNSPTCPAAPPQGSPPPGTAPPGQPSPQASTPAGKAPAGKGPFQGDPENREWLRQNWDPDPLKAHDAARPLGDPAIYDNADQAALARYNQARGQGMDDQAARQESWNEWWNSVQAQRQARGIYKLANNPFFEWVGNAPAPGTAPESDVAVGSGAVGGDP